MPVTHRAYPNLQYQRTLDIAKGMKGMEELDEYQKVAMNWAK